MPDAVSTTTSHPGAAARRRGSADRPSRPGIERSSRTRSGWSDCASSSAAAPSAASPTTSKPPAPSSDESASRVSGWSSTIRIRSDIVPSHRQTLACRLGGRAEEESKGHVRGVARRRAAARCPARLGDGAFPHEPDPPQHVRAARGPARARHCGRPGRDDRRDPRRRPLLGGRPHARPAAGGRLLRCRHRHAGVLRRPGPGRLESGRARGLGGDRLPSPRRNADRARAARAGAADHRQEARTSGRDRDAARCPLRDLAAPPRASGPASACSTRPGTDTARSSSRSRPRSSPSSRSWR